MQVVPKEYEGSVCELKSMENELIATGVVGEITEDYVRIDARANPIPMQRYGIMLKVNVFNSREGFRVLVGKVYAASTRFLKLIEVTSLLDYERRNFFRIEADQPAWIVKKNEETDEWEDAQRVSIRDISLGGVLLEWPDGEMKTGAHIFLRLKLGRFNQVVECVICRTEDRAGVPYYGCEFQALSMPQSDAICQYIFQRQREQIQKNKFEQNSLNRGGI
ncbi:MAG: PilZ domain-containing protein [Oscillospiraceae bacterium]|nr:PilZ domain-containing protein [Oscillospiraceae bacterium]